MKTTKVIGISDLNKMLLKKSMFFYNDFEECVVRSLPNDDKGVDYWIKYKGHIEFKGTTHNTNIYETVHIYSLSISEKQYDEY